MPRPNPPGRTRVPKLRLGVVVVCALALVAGGFAVAGVRMATEMGSVAVTAVVAPGGSYTPPRLRQRVDLAGTWRFVRSDVPGAAAPTFDDASWSSVTVPHTWNAVDGADGGNNYYRGVGWYRRHFPVATTLAGKMFFLEFAGVNQVADVWVNGTYQGQHRGGYSRFRFGVTAATRIGLDNVLAVKVTNAADPDIAPLTADYTFDGGIYRGVSLWAVDPLQVRLLDDAGPGVYLRQRDIRRDAATVEVTTRLVNNDSVSRAVVVRTVVTDAGGVVVADQSSPVRSVNAAAGEDVTQAVTITKPHRWNGRADPYQYHANVEVRDAQANRVTDVVTEPLGLRTFDVDPERGFVLNGHPLFLRGVNLHQDRAGVGWAVSDTEHVQDMDLVAEVGANAIRMAHYQHDQLDYTLADELGFVVWAEIPLIEAVTATPAFAANAEQQLRELIRQNYNHPSIVFWGIGNEQRVDDVATNTLLDRLAATVTAADPDRLSTYAHCCLSPDSAVAGHAKTLGYNKYLGWYTGSADDLGGWLDYLHALAPARRFALSEYGAGGNTTQHAQNPQRPLFSGPVHPEEYQAQVHETSWKQIDARPYLWGSFLWNMFDFASDGRDEGSQPGINDKGLVTRDRAVRKDSFYWYKANWAPTPTLYVTSRRWTERTDAATEVKVYSNAASVSATLNGVPLGATTSQDHIFRWPGITLSPGRNNVTVTATIDGAPYTDTVVWNLGPPTPRRAVAD